MLPQLQDDRESHLGGIVRPCSGQARPPLTRPGNIHIRLHRVR